MLNEFNGNMRIMSLYEAAYYYTVIMYSTSSPSLADMSLSWRMLGKLELRKVQQLVPVSAHSMSLCLLYMLLPSGKLSY